MWSFVEGLEAVRSVYDTWKLEITETHKRCVEVIYTTKPKPYQCTCDLKSEMTKLYQLFNN